MQKKRIIILGDNLLIGNGIAESLHQMRGDRVIISSMKNIIRGQTFDVIFVSASKILKNLAEIAILKKEYANTNKDTKMIIFSSSDQYLDEVKKLGLGDLYIETFFLVGEIDNETKEKLLPLLI
jgi:hypothetical protein